MKGLSPEQISRYLSALAEIKRSCRIYDTHVHPYEILFDRFSYAKDPAAAGVLSVPGRSYAAPARTSFAFPEIADFGDSAEAQRLQGISVMLLKKVYGSVGERVFGDHMALAGIDRVLLLPAAPEKGDPARFEERMRWVKETYRNEEKFLIAGSIPPALPVGEVKRYAERLKREFGIRALKCHPVVSGIDLGSSERKGWLEAMLSACGELGLPLVIHGGRNNAYWGGSRGDFGSIRHLKEIDFSLSGAPVILAHAALHRCKLTEMEQEGLPMLQRMLEKHGNLRVDVSGLGFEQLKLVLRSVDGGRIVFGSDALYSPQWEALTMTMHALAELSAGWEREFVRIASSNPEKIIFKGDSHARHVKDQIPPVPGRGAGEVAARGGEEGARHLSATGPDRGPGLQ